jgi:primosomal protein N' (replication factor Y) (superfamily II helicase)
MSKIAKLAIQSGLPQLDRLFDYAVPEELVESVEVGSRVKVSFGKAKKSLDGFVVSISSTSEFEGKLSEIQSVVGDRPALQPDVFSLCSQLAERSASSLGELLKIAVPAHMPRSFSNHKASDTSQGPIAKEFESSFDDDYVERLSKGPARSFALAEPRSVSHVYKGKECSSPSWVSLFLSVAWSNLDKGKSTIILVPDYREHAIVLSAMRQVGLEKFLADYSAELPKSKQYEGFLRALDSSPRVIVGSRLAAFAPAYNLGSILIFDEADRSYIDQASPYLHTRDVVLVRQSIQDCSVLFCSHSISTDALRLIDTGYLSDQTLAFAAPRISISEPGMRVDGHAFTAIKDGLKEGAVLVQVSSLGDSTALYCKKCDEPASCKTCNGPLWVDSSGVKKCRWCNGFALDYVCNCGSSEFSLGRAGSTRTAAELGRAFPNARVIESTGDNRLINIAASKSLVVATAGAEPYVDGGYFAVVLLDAKVLLGRQNLRAVEESVRAWSNAVAKARSSAPCVLVGVSGEMSKLYSLWNHARIAAVELASRQELLLPPAVRLGSVTAELDMVTSISSSLSGFASVVRIGPAPVANSSGQEQWRLIFKYPYSEVQNIAKILKLEVSKVAAGKTRVTASGRSARAVTVKMNDAEVV